MIGDNFRTVSGDVQAWALRQYFAVNDLPVRPASSRPGKDIEGPLLPIRDRLPRVVRQIVDTEVALHGVTWDEFSAVATLKRAKRRVQRAYRAVFYAISTQMTWGGAPPTQSQIAHWLDRHPSTVNSGLAAERARIAAEAAA